MAVACFQGMSVHWTRLLSLFSSFEQNVEGGWECDGADGVVRVEGSWNECMRQFVNRAIPQPPSVVPKPLFQSPSPLPPQPHLP